MASAPSPHEEPLLGRPTGTQAQAQAQAEAEAEAAPALKSPGVSHAADHTELDFVGDIHIQVPEHGLWWEKLWAYLGPGFLVAIAYIDPGNFETDLQAGAQYQYSLLWVLFWASVGGLVLQSLCANLGIVTGMHLAQHCRVEYAWGTRMVLWVIAEVEIVASDIPEVIGTAFALNVLFGVPLWVGVVLTGFSTILFLGIQRFGVRWLELFIALLVAVMCVCFFLEMRHVSVDWAGVAQGLVVPRFQDAGATALAISLVGAVVMPHNLFLHSALVLSRKQARTARAVQEGCHYCLVEVSIALAVALAVNVAVICVGGAVCADPSTPGVEQQCKDIDLNNAFFLLSNTLGSWASTVFGVALLASGQSSTVTGTFAGQHVMDGFLELRMEPWTRNLLTRLVAIVPSLAVAILGGARGAGQLIIISSMVLSFGLPYALIPLLKFTSSPIKMGPFANSLGVTAVTCVIGGAVILVNCYFVLALVYDWLVTSTAVHSVYLFPLACACIVLVILYFASLVYLSLRPDKVRTFEFLDGPLAQGAVERTGGACGDGCPE